MSEKDDRRSIDARIHARTVTNSTIVGVQQGVDAAEVGAIVDQVVRDRLSMLHRYPELDGLVPEPASRAVLRPDDPSHLRRAEGAYERALELSAAGEVDQAQDILLSVLACLAGNPTTRGRSVRARAALRLGDIRRDRGAVGGVGGAFNLFGGAYWTAATLDDTPIRTEAAIYIASCYEMSEHYASALEAFGHAGKLAEQTGQGLYEVWARLREQSILTKTGHAETAAANLASLAPETAWMDTVRLHRVCLLKQAAACKKIGDYERALECAFDACRLVDSPTALASVQHNVLLGDLYLCTGSEGEGIHHLALAEKYAQQHGFAHQLKAVDNVFGAYLGIPVHKRTRPDPNLRFQPVERPAGSPP